MKKKRLSAESDFETNILPFLRIRYEIEKQLYLFSKHRLKKEKGNKNSSPHRLVQALLKRNVPLKALGKIILEIHGIASAAANPLSQRPPTPEQKLFVREHGKIVVQILAAFNE